jgi:hypothetical protein
MTQVALDVHAMPIGSMLFINLCAPILVDEEQVVNAEASQDDGKAEEKADEEFESGDQKDETDEFEDEDDGSGSSKDGSQLELLKGHPRCKNRALEPRKLEVVVRVSGRRLPDSRMLKEDAKDDGRSTELREAFASAAMIMFLPWRDLNDLMIPADQNSWWKAFQRHSAADGFSDESLRILRNMQMYHESFVRKADEKELPYPKELVAPDVDGQADDSDDDEKSIQIDQVVPGSEDFDGVPIECGQVKGLQALDSTTYSFQSSQDMARAPLNVTQSNVEAALTGHQRDPVVEASTVAASSLAPELLTQAIVGACDDLGAWKGSFLKQVPTEPANRPTIGSASRLFTLNAEQHKVFVLFAASLLEGLLCDVPEEKEDMVVAAKEALSRILKPSLAGDAEEELQLRFFLSGPAGRNIIHFAEDLFVSHFISRSNFAGTGKSRVLQALVDFSRRWHCSDAIVLTATSGIAGVLIKGETYHRTLGLGGKGDQDDGRQERKVARQDREKWVKRRVFVVDEVSMLAGNGLAKIDERLRQLKDPTKPFGGIHMLFCGDLFQLGAMGTGSVFSTTNQSKAHNDGRKLWRQLNSALELIHSVRQQDDPRYAELLDRFQTNEPIREDVILLNTRVLSETVIPPHGASFVTPYNAPREQLNATAFHHFCAAKYRTYSAEEQKAMHQLSWRRMGAIRILATFTKLIGKGRNLMEAPSISANKLKALYATEQTSLENLPARLDIILGGNVLITHNICVQKGVANGTSASVMQVLLDEKQVRWSETARCYVIEAKHVHSFVLKNHQAPFNQEDHYPPLPVGHFPLQKLGKHNSVASFRWERGHKLIPAGNRVKSNIRFRVGQFPMVSKHVLTGHKIQGQTVGDLVILPLQKKKSGGDGLLYVALSRVPSLQRLFLTEKLDEDVTKYKKRKIVIDEMRRIRSQLIGPTTKRMDDLLALLDSHSASSRSSESSVPASDGSSEAVSSSASMPVSLSSSAP